MSMGKYSYNTQNNLPFPFIYVTETFSVSQKLNLGPPGSVDKIKGHKRKIWGQRFEKRIDNHSGCPALNLHQNMAPCAGLIVAA